MLKKILSYVLSTALIFESSFVWGQKPANPPHILFETAQEYMQNTGLNKPNTTWGQWFEKSKLSFDPEIRGKIGRWVKLNSNKKMPTFEISRGKKTDDKISLNVTVKDGSKSKTFELVKTEDDYYIVVDNLRLNHTNLYYGTLVDRVFGFSPLMSAHKMKTLAKTHPKSVQKYFRALQEYMATYEQYQNVFTGSNNSKPKKVSFWQELIPNTYAASSNDRRCLIAGWPIGLIKGNGQCYAGKENRNKLRSNDCQPNQYGCNPNIYGHSNCVDQDLGASKISATCFDNASSDEKINQIVKEIYNDNNLNTEVKNQFEDVFNSCLNETAKSEFSEALSAKLRPKAKQELFTKIENNLSQNVIEQTAGKCKDLKNQGITNCNQHNKIACDKTLTQIIKLLKTQNDISTQICEHQINLLQCPMESCDCKTPPPITVPGIVTNPPAKPEVPVEDHSDTAANIAKEFPERPAQKKPWYEEDWFLYPLVGVVSYGLGIGTCFIWKFCGGNKTITNTVIQTQPSSDVTVQPEYVVNPPTFVPEEPVETIRDNGGGAKSAK